MPVCVCVCMRVCADARVFETLHMCVRVYVRGGSRGRRDGGDNVRVGQRFVNVFIYLFILNVVS